MCLQTLTKMLMLASPLKYANLFMLKLRTSVSIINSTVTFYLVARILARLTEHTFLNWGIYDFCENSQVSLIKFRPKVLNYLELFDKIIEGWEAASRTKNSSAKILKNTYRKMRLHVFVPVTLTGIFWDQFETGFWHGC